MRVANPRGRFVVVGDGPLRASLAAKHGYCRFTGFVDRDVLAEHYASADIYLHGSVTETYGNVAAEALASGLAFAGYDYAAAHELVQPENNGLLVPLGDEAAFLASAGRLATDPGLVAWLRAQAAPAVQARAWSSIIGQFEADLLEAATGSGRASVNRNSEFGNSKSPSLLLP